MLRKARRTRRATSGAGALVLGTLLAALAAAGMAAESGHDALALAVSPSASSRLPLPNPSPTPVGGARSERKGPASEPSFDEGAVRAAIEQANAKWLEAFRRGDASGMARRYTDDASVLPPGSATLQGRERIAAYFISRRAEGIGDLRLNTSSVVRVGELAYETGTWSLASGAADDQGRIRPSDSGRYYAIWKTQPDGSWGCQVGIWDSNRDQLSLR
jgi:uncharacterized protein (TIGR02246 family)